ncbi:MAG TPA: FG-GAP-like repeat-containing protein [Acidobacteriaceae bacterium]|nr:FG-GAP-like repeat-containing protein [Acidobacteriaceae bacterium]
MTVTSAGTSVTTVASGAVISLTATVKSGSTALTTGQVNFCDAAAKYCTDIHVLGTAQLTSAGTAVIKFRPGIGSHSYKAMFTGTNSMAASSSSVSALTVTGAHVSYATSSTIAESGSWGDYTLTATVTETGGTAAPTGTASFLDTTAGNTAIATAQFGAATPGLAWLNPQNPAAGFGPQSIVSGDFNGDGIADLAVGNSRDNTVSIFLGNLDGTFTATATMLAVNAPGMLVAADFNQDGKLDLAVPSNTSSGAMTIFLGNGNGTFTQAATSPAVLNWTDLTVAGDFNRDGIPDLAVASQPAGIISMLLGNGDGTFSSSQITTSTGCISGLAPGDFNGDGKTDLAVASDCEFNNGNPVLILLGNGDGTFPSVVTPQLTAAAESVVVADFNGDGKADLAVANNNGTAATILLGQGDGTFTIANLSPSFPTHPGTIAWGDFNGDGIVDLALPNVYNNTVSIYVGNGDGTFTLSAVTPPTGDEPLAIAIGDFNGDGLADVATADYFDNTVAILLSQPTQTASAVASGVVIAEVGLHQVDASYSGDTNYHPSLSGTLPLWGVPPATTTTLSISSGGAAVASITAGSVVTLTAAVKAGTKPLTAGQVNFCDASAAYCTDIHLLGAVQLTSNGTATFKFVPGVGTHSYKAVFLENGSGAPSASVVSTLNVTAIAGTKYSTTTAIAQSGVAGNYTLTATVTGVGSSTPPTGTVSFLDTTYANAVLGTASLGSATPGLTWLQSQTPATGTGPIAEVVGDFNRDGKADIATLNQSAATVTILLGNGDGTFAAVSSSPVTGSTPYAITAADFNGDGNLDLAVANGDGTGTLTILLGNGDGSFTAAASPVAGEAPESIVAGDFNGDGIPDLLAGLYNQTVLLVGHGDGTFAPPSLTLIPGVWPNSLVAADLNGDGILDVAAANGFNAIAILLGNGDGTFRASETIEVQLYQSAVALADFNRDGKLDLAVTNSGQEALTVFPGNGDGTFAQTGVMTNTVQATPQGIAIGDFNGDGLPDIALSTGNFNVPILLGNGDGTFAVSATNPQTSYIYTYANFVAAGDFNGDGRSDIAGAETYSNAVQLFLTEPSQTAVAVAASIAPTTPGPHLVDASYPGNSNYTSSVSDTTSLSSQVATPVISPAAGTYTTIQTVRITDATPGAAIYYTTSGYPPDTTSTLYTGPITVSSATETIQAIAVATGYVQSPAAAAAYTLNLPTPVPPVISLASGTYANAQTVTISDTTPNTAIYYTTNGSKPTISSPQYTGPITVSSSETLVAVAAYGYAESTPVSAQYLINSSSTSLIYTVAGNGFLGYGGDGGQATLAYLNDPSSVIGDSAGNLYIADARNNAVRKISAGTGVITTIAGNGIAGYTGDGGAATKAELESPGALAFDPAGNLYISDFGNNVVRKITTSTGIISTYAGNGTLAYSGDNGPATAASIGSNVGIAFDASGNLYIVQYSFGRVRKVAAGTGTITTVAGNGSYGYFGDGGLATSAAFAYPQGIAADSAGNIFITDTGNSVIRKVSALTGNISTVAGHVDPLNYGQYSGDGGPATAAALYSPEGVALDSAGNLYIADTDNQAIRKVAAATQIITTIAGNGSKDLCDPYGGDGGPATSSALCYPQGVMIDSKGNLYIADSNSDHIREVTAAAVLPSAQTAPPVLSVSGGTYAGPQTVNITDTTPGAAIYLTLDGAAPSTLSPNYSGPIAVTGNVTIRAIAVAPGYLASAPATANYTITSPPQSVISTVAGSDVAGFGGQGGPATSAQISGLQGLIVDGSGNYYFADAYNNVIWTVSAKTGNISVVVGIGQYGHTGDGGPATSATLDFPMGLALDKSQNLYIADSDNNVVRKVDAVTGVISTYAGNGQVNLNTNGDGGLATSAEIYHPTGLALDNAGNLYVSETYGGRVRMVSASTGIITTYAGNENGVLVGDGGPATSATLPQPGALAIDAGGNLYIATAGRIRKVTAGTGIITTFAGNGDAYGVSGDGGAATNAEVYPNSLAFDTAGNLYMSNWPASIRKVTAATGVITRVAGAGYSGFSGDGGSATVAEIADPQGIAFDSTGNLYIADGGNARIRKVTFSAATANQTTTPAFSVPAGRYTSAQSVAITDSTAGATIYYTTDGSTPTTVSAVYSGPIAVSHSETLEAIAIAPGYTQSPIAAAAYTIQILITPSLTVTPSSSNIADDQAVSVAVAVSGVSGQPTPTGSVTLASGSYSAMQTLSAGTATFNLSAGTLASGVDTLSAAYSGDTIYAAANGSGVITVSSVAVSVPAPPAVSPGSSATATVTLSAGATYSGTMNLTCALTASPAGAKSLPTCSLAPASVTIHSRSTATSVLTVQTTAGGSTALLQPHGQTLRWLGSGGGVLAAAMLFCIPARRRRWRATLVLVLMSAGLGMMGCGGGGGSQSSPPPPVTPATTAGNYVFTITGTDTANAQITTSGNVTVTVQ